FSVLFSLGSVFFYQHELLLRIKLEKTAFVSAAGILVAAMFCQHQKISVQWFMHITVKYYGPVFAVLLIWAGIAVRKKRTWKKAGVLGILLILLTYLSGCGVSLEKRIFPLSMSADYVQGNYRIIYGIPELTSMTGQNKKDTEESQPQAIVYEGKTPEEAEENFNRNQKNYLDMGHIKTLILGEGILEQKDALEGLLDALERKPSVAGNIYVFACQNPEELMKFDGQGKDSVGDFLTGILENNLSGKPKDAVTLQDLYNAWHRKEQIPKLPIVTVVNNKPEIRQYS
ncbi:MAG: spore gernimation protein, partial [Blautia sp.]|nr:spore gernimation protein [Blautia sp.]